MRMKRSTGSSRIASSSTRVPSTLVATNSDAPSTIDFSTCDSAAPLTITSTDETTRARRRPRRAEALVPDVALDERKPLVGADVREVLEVSGVGERVQRDDLVRRRLQQGANEGRRDKPGAAGDQNPLGHARSLDARLRLWLVGVRSCIATRRGQ